MLEVQVQLQRAELGCVTRAEFVPVVDVNGLFFFPLIFPPPFLCILLLVICLKSRVPRGK